MSLRIAILALFAVVLTPTLAIAGLVVDSQVTGAGTNCELLFDTVGRAAVLFELRGPRIP